jgi:hypothetical protein
MLFGMICGIVMMFHCRSYCLLLLLFVVRGWNLPNTYSIDLFVDSILCMCCYGVVVFVTLLMVLLLC